MKTLQNSFIIVMMTTLTMMTTMTTMMMTMTTTMMMQQGDSEILKIKNITAQASLELLPLPLER